MEFSSAEIIKMERERVGISQAELARRCGVPQPHISNYEAGRHQPSFDTVRRLIAALGGRLRITVPVILPDPLESARSLEAVLGLIDMLPDIPWSQGASRIEFPRIPAGRP